MSQETGKAFAYDHLKNYKSSSLEKKYKEMSDGSNYVLFIQFFFNIIYAHLEFEASNVFQKDQARQQKY